MMDLLKQLCALPGVSSFEDAVRDYIKEQAAPYVDTMNVDAMGNPICFKKGAKATGTKLMLCAHMDEVGLMVRSITEDGYLKFVCVGGMDRRVLLGKQMLVGDRQIPGVIGLKAIHMTTAQERKKVPKLEDYYIDIGASSREEAEALVEVGDRVGCAVLLELLRRDLPMDCTFVFTVQEEVGTRGAFGAAFSVTPDIALVLEGTTAADAPSQDPEAQICHLGQGPVLSWMDKGTIYDRDLFERLRAVAQEHNIPWQLKRYVAGSTDAKAIQRTKSGVRVAGISAPVRYLHAPASVLKMSDVEQVLELAWLFLQSIAGDC